MATQPKPKQNKTEKEPALTIVKPEDNQVIPAGLPQISYHWFTPAELLEDLEEVKKSRRRPRGLSRKKIDSFCRAMLEKRWRSDTAEPMKYDSDGLMMDGFHRANAVIKAGIPVLMGMVTSMDKSVEPILDGGTARSKIHVLQMSGYKYVTSLASACSAIWCMERKIHKMETYVDNQTVHNIVEKYSNLEAYVGECSRHAFIRSGQIVAAFYWVEAASPDAGGHFVEGVLTGAEGDEGLRITDIRYMLREALISRQGGRRGAFTTFEGRNTTIATIFRSFKQWRLEMPKERISFTMDEKHYPWPESKYYVVE